MNTRFQRDKVRPTAPLSRRHFLMSAAVLGALAAMHAPKLITAAMAADSSDMDFIRLSSFLTGKHALDAVSAQRFFAALSKRNTEFAASAGALLRYIDRQKFVDMDAFLEASKTDTAKMAIATSIVSAWYLGIVGAAADAELVTYESALMYQPTKGILAVPTYGPGPLAWGETPPGADDRGVVITRAHT